MGRRLFSAVSAVVLTIGAGAAKGVVVNLDLSAGNFTHTRVYRQNSSTTDFREDLRYATPVGLIGPNEPITVRLNFSEPIQLEDFYSGKDFFLRMQLLRGSAVSGYNENLTTTLDVTGLVDLSTETLGSGGWLSEIEGGTVEHEVAAHLTPTETFGQFGGADWTYTSPSWTPDNTDVRLEFLLTLQTRDISPSVLSDPGRDLITFVPEPSTAALLVGALSLLMVQPRSRRSGL